MFFLAVVMIALWAVLCYGLPSFGLHGHGANAMLAHARTHGGTTGILLVGLSIVVLVVVTTVVFRSEPERTPAQTIAVWVTIILSSWAMVLYLQWGHAWVAQGGGPRKALTCCGPRGRLAAVPLGLPGLAYAPASAHGAHGTGPHRP